MAESPRETGRNVARTGTQQSETKHSTKTSELYAFVAVVVVVAILISAAVIGESDGENDEFIARQAWLYVSIVTAGYLVSRGLAKAGSRDPSTADHDH